MSWVYLKWFYCACQLGRAVALAGAFLVAMNLSFMGVCLSHAALAGAVLAYWIGTPVLSHCAALFDGGGGDGRSDCGADPDPREHDHEHFILDEPGGLPFWGSG